MDFGFSKKFNSLASSANDRVKKAAGVDLPRPPNANFPKTDASKDKTIKSLIYVDPFIAWEVLTPSDYLQKFLYEFVIWDEQKQSVIYRFSFPLNPQSISVSSPSAVAITPTMKGILEEHNGAPLRSISIVGTTGISQIDPTKGSSGTKSSDRAGISAAKALFGNTIRSAGRVVDAGTAAIKAGKSAIGGTSSDIAYFNFMTTQSSLWKQGQDLTDGPATETGYYTVHNLARFFDFYLAAKKTVEGKSYRLVFQMHKDKMYYDVALNGFSFNKPPGTLEYNYSISLTAWRRRDKSITQRKQSESAESKSKKLSVEQRILQGVASLKKGRAAIAAASQTLTAIKSDVSQVFSYVNEGILLLTDTANLVVSIVDLIGFGNPNSSIWALIESEVVKSLSLFSLKPSLGDVTDKLKSSMDENNDPSYLGLESNINDNAAQLANATNSSSQNASQETADSGISLRNPAVVSKAFSELSLDDLDSSVLNEIKETQLEQVKLLTADDFRAKRDFVSGLLTSFSESFSATANRETGIDIQDIEALYGMNEIVMGLDALIAVLDDANDVRENDYADFYRDFAISNGIDFQESQSKFYVPFPYGSSLESLAYEYLGDPDRWIEIAAINGLKAPYIDEEGFEIKLTNSAIGDSATVSNAKNLYIGQVVQVLSDTKKPVVRKIRSIDIYSSIEAILIFEKVEGSSLSGYKLSDNARIRTFLPNTVNSLKLIAIPSLEAPTITGRIRLGAQPEDLNALARTAKTDFLLNGNGDIVFTSGGDVKTSSGLTNLTQAAVIKLRTKIGSILQNPGFGAAVEPGTPTSEIDAQSVLESIENAFAQDSRFSGILSATVEKNGNQIVIKVLLGVSGTDSLLPLETSIPL